MKYHRIVFLKPVILLTNVTTINLIKKEKKAAAAQAGQAYVIL